MIAHDNFNDFVKALELELDGNLPGFDAQKTMSPSIREDLDGNSYPNGNTRQSAVLIMLFPDNNNISTLFIKRSVYDGPHSGQISFPGGKYDPHDLTIQTTALRETHEEVGVVGSQINLIGKLTPLYIPISNMMVNPFIGALNSKPSCTPNNKEVEKIIITPINVLLDPKIRNVRNFVSHGKHISAPYFDVCNEFIWGATAMILAEFLDSVNSTIKKGL